MITKQEIAKMAEQSDQIAKGIQVLILAYEAVCAELERLRIENVQLRAERDQARNLLDRCWDAAGLLGADVTGKPGQAWEELSNLVAQIAWLVGKADATTERLEDS